jgi:hypothetical protein
VRVATCFGVSEGTVFLCITLVILALLRLWKSYLKWPEPGSTEYRGLKSAIAEQSPYFEGCVGFVDGSEIILTEKPLLGGESQQFTTISKTERQLYNYRRMRLRLSTLQVS